MSVRGSFSNELRVAIGAAHAAGDSIRDLYNRAVSETYVKPDGSPVTDADLASDRIIRDILTSAFPDDAILTEEGVDDETRLAADRVWIVDPIDGTQQFVSRTGEFDVLISLISLGEPVVGVLLQPTTGVYLAAAAGRGAILGDGEAERQFSFDRVPEERSPRLETSFWLNVPDSLPGLGQIAERLGTSAPDISVCGIVPRHFIPPMNRHDVLIGLPTKPGQTMAWEWDFAAADIVVREAGGAFTDAWGNRFIYNKRLPRNIGGIVMSVDPNTHQRVIDAMAPELPS